METMAGEAKLDFESIKAIILEHFQVEDALMEFNVPTFYLKQNQETKEPFLKVLKKLDEMNLIAFLRKSDGRVFIKVLPKPPSKPIDVRVNWLLLILTICTTFATGYILSASLAQIGGPINPIVGGALFTISIMAIFGLHEIGHKIAARKEGVDATPPYFIPGPPPVGGIFGIGTFGAIILQRTLPPNKDALFDIGLSGPIVSFIMATIISAVGSLIAVPAEPTEATMLPAPLMMLVIGNILGWLGVAPQAPPGKALYMHPVEFAGWVGMLITSLNLLPAAMLDGGHIARSVLGDRARSVLTFLSILILVLSDFWLMALFVLFMSMQKHPGPLDDVSGLSRGRKALAALLVAVFILTFPILR
ncbi:MAG: site-2 protease family protein [Candidatus Bathyarchaeia archaeon]